MSRKLKPRFKIEAPGVFAGCHNEVDLYVDIEGNGIWLVWCNQHNHVGKSIYSLSQYKFISRQKTWPQQVINRIETIRQMLGHDKTTT